MESPWLLNPFVSFLRPLPAVTATKLVASLNKLKTAVAETKDDKKIILDVLTLMKDPGVMHFMMRIAAEQDGYLPKELSTSPYPISYDPLLLLMRNAQTQLFLQNFYKMLYLMLSHNINFHRIDSTFHFPTETQTLQNIKGIYFYVSYLNASYITQQTKKQYEQNSLMIQKPFNLDQLLILACEYRQFHSFEMLLAVLKNYWQAEKKPISEAQSIKLAQYAYDLPTLYRTPGCLLSTQIFFFLTIQALLQQSGKHDNYLQEAIYFLYVGKYLLPVSKIFIQELYFNDTVSQWNDGFNFDKLDVLALQILLQRSTPKLSFLEVNSIVITLKNRAFLYANSLKQNFAVQNANDSNQLTAVKNTPSPS